MAGFEGVAGTTLNDMMKEVTVEDVEWITQDDNLKFSRPDLKPLAKVWYHVLRHKMLLTTHLETVDKERLVLLYCTLKGKKVNVGKLVEKETLRVLLNPGGICFPLP